VVSRFDRTAGGLALLSGSFLMIGGVILPRPLLDPDPTLPADPGRHLLQYADSYGGFLLVLLLLALVGVGIAMGLPLLARRQRILAPSLLDQAARWGFAAGLLWVLRSLFVATVQGPWALRFAGDLEPAARKETILLVWPLMRQVEWFFQWGAAVCFGLACLFGGLVYVRWAGRRRVVGVLHLGAAGAVLASLLYVLPFYYPLRFAGPGFPRLGAYLCSVAMYETAALAMLAAGALLWYGAPGWDSGEEEEA